jgi:hypothetical protein
MIKLLYISEKAEVLIMRINADCMRGLLVYLEKHIEVKLINEFNMSIKNDYILKEVCSDKIFEDKKSGEFATVFSDEDIYYALVQLIKFGYIEASHKGTAKNKWDIRDINPAGYIFLETGKLAL